MRGDDGHREQVWNKRGSRFQLPRLPRPSLKTLLKAVPGVGIVALSLVGFLAVPAGSPPPPPAVAAEPIATYSVTPSETPAPEPSPTEVVFPTDQDPPHCTPRAHRISGDLAAGTIAYTDIEHQHVYLYEPTTRVRTLALDGKGSCAFSNPRFLDAHTFAYNLGSAYIREMGSFVVNTATARMKRITGSRRDWTWLTATVLSPDGSRLAELGSLDQAQSFLLRVISTRTGAVLFSRSIGFICYCDGSRFPKELRWSADGAYLLISVDGSSDNDLFVIDAKGHDARKPTGGRYPRWIAATHAFIYQDSKANWVEVGSLTATPKIFLRSGVAFADPALSPDAGKIAFWDTGKWNVAIYDLSTKTLKRYGTLQVYPLWLDNGTIATAGARPCSCEGFGFEFTGAGWSLTLRTGGSHRTPMLTFDADVLR